MPTPPILDIYVLWHPTDDVGQEVFDRIHAHFHSAAYSGLAGGAVEVYGRSVGWATPGSTPRPLPLPGSDDSTLEAAQLCAIVPVLGLGLRDAVQSDAAWANYVRAIADSENGTVSVLPVHIPGVNLADSTLQAILGPIQRIPDEAVEEAAGLLERSVAQAIAQQAAGSTEPIRVFISHAKHFSDSEAELPGPPLYERVRSVISGTHLADFFDARDLQPGTRWAAELDKQASRSALLMVRTDQYASRKWTQREVLFAKQHDVPIVSVIALSEGEARGSFLMDHVPTVPLHHDAVDASITAGLNRLVDEVLKRALWAAQSTYIRAEGFDWTPVHAPEPVTAVAWLNQHRSREAADTHLWIIHPDPPLGPCERAIVDDMCALAGFDARIDILTPRTFAARGGVLDEQ